MTCEAPAPAWAKLWYFSVTRLRVLLTVTSRLRLYHGVGRSSPTSRSRLAW